MDFGKRRSLANYDTVFSFARRDWEIPPKISFSTAGVLTDIRTSTSQGEVSELFSLAVTFL